MTVSYKLLKELKKSDRRRELGLAVIEGVRLVMDAFHSGIEFESLVVSKSFESGEKGRKTLGTLKITGIDPVILSDSLYNAACDTKTPQGILAIVKTTEYSLEDILGKAGAPGIGYAACLGGEPGKKCEPRQYVILDRVSDPGNVGSIIRTAEAACFRGIIMSTGCADVYSSKTLRASMGSALRFPVVSNADLAESIRALRDFGVIVLASAPDARKSYYSLDLSGDMAFVIGSEAFGVDRGVMGVCDGVLRLPMPGNVESLNAGVAAGILVYEALRQRLEKPE
ncbi:MAG: RNA methyltransferase [Oscillospiraceae bacterium]|nr:RNA methyltransferase [Oscillospiraceae bacterium]